MVFFTRGEANDSAFLSSRDSGHLEPPERLQGSPASSSVWREDSGLVSRPCRKIRPSSRDDPGPLGTPLGLAQWKRASSRGETGNLGFLSFSDSNHRALQSWDTALSPRLKHSLTTGQSQLSDGTLLGGVLSLSDRHSCVVPCHTEPGLVHDWWPKEGCINNVSCLLF